MHTPSSAVRLIEQRIPQQAGPSAGGGKEGGLQEQAIGGAPQSIINDRHRNRAGSNIFCNGPGGQLTSQRAAGAARPLVSLLDIAWLRSVHLAGTSARSDGDAL
jgi:hypothetical protein